MIIVGLPCDFCNSSTVNHCPETLCKWSRCPRCNSYGLPGTNFVQWRKDDYINPYGLNDIKVMDPERKMPDWLNEVYGTRQVDDAPGA